MKSLSGLERVTFAVLQARLIAAFVNRIRNGDFTERGLARILGISQPQIHNVLKGVRKLQPELADRMMRVAGLTVLDLLHDDELYEEALSRDRVAVPHRLETDIRANVSVPRGKKDELPARKKPFSKSLLLISQPEEKVG